MPDKPSVDDLRARLRELGYLDAGVDRFVLGAVRGSRGPLSLAWRSSLRIGLLAAILLGPSAAAALAARLPGLVTGGRDAIVLALYLALFFGLAVFVIALAAAILLGSAARVGTGGRFAGRARALARAAAVVVSGGCLAYLVFWWRAVGTARSLPSGTAWTLGVLAVAVAISLLLGHAVRVMTLAIVVRAKGAPDLLTRPRRPRWLVPVLALGAFAVGALLLFLLPPRSDAQGASSAGPTRLAVVDTGLALTVMAVDGLDVQYVERLRQAGRVPALGRLLAGAAAELPASDAPDPARTWTSLATGQPAAVHGVSGIEARRVSGIAGTVGSSPGGAGAMIGAATDLLRLTRPALITAQQRRSKTFWEVAAEHGVPTLIVNWWATWPVPEGPGVVLSDRATLRLDRGGHLDAEIAPPALYPALRAEWPRLRARARQRVAAAFPNEAVDPVFSVLRRAAEQDALALELMLRAPAKGPRLEAVYFPGLDIAQFELVGRAGSSLPASALASRVEALGRYYDFLDGLVASLLKEEGAGNTPGASPGAREDELVALVTDPGRSASGGSGLLAFSGKVTRAGARARAGRDDVVPTLLYALGLPVSRELPGRALTGLFEPAFVNRVPLRFAPTYGPRRLAPRPPDATPLDQEMLDRLRSLGYVR